MSELSLWLDAYDDVFSDFDSRNYLKRRVSEDFIEELRMSLKYRKDRPDALLLLMPAEQRHQDMEQQIILSINQQFGERWTVLHESVRRILFRGFIMLCSGLLIMMLSSVIVYRNQQGYVPVLLRVILEPAGWFIIWNALDSLMYEYRKIKKEQAFYRILSRLKIYFKDI